MLLNLNKFPPVPLAGILNLAVQVGQGQFKSGSSDISDAHAIEQFPQPMHINGSRNIWPGEHGRKL